MSMTKDEKRIAIAIACGWKKVTYASQGIHHSTSEGDWGWLSPDGIFYGPESFRLPNYLNDLNAMSEAEKAIINSDDTNWFSRYIVELFRTCGTRAIIAPPQERAEAFLKSI